MGPVPLRTARGEGRPDFFVERPLPLLAGFLRAWLPDDRVVVEDFEPALGPALDVPRFRDAGGEDVRVAMVTNLRDRHTRHLLHTPC
jgi:hypothetical protein